MSEIPKATLLIAGVGLFAVFWGLNYTLDCIENALDEAFNGDRHD